MSEIEVLIRSCDRASLHRAVASVLAQEGVQVRVLVVPAGGQPLHHLGSLASDARVQVLPVGPPLPRAKAANCALNALKAPLALFLDDDDWLMPGHLSRLRDALLAYPEALATHTGVEVVSGEPPQRVHVYDQAVDPLRMLLQNQLPIHAVLFRRSALEAAGPLRFDETLDHFEDWDFWLRLLEYGPMVHVPGVSAVYWLDAAEGSGHANAGLHRDEQLEALAGRQLQRWSPSVLRKLMQWSGEQDASLAAAEQRSEALGQQLTDLTRSSRTTIDGLEAERKRAVETLEQQLAQVGELRRTMTLAQQQYQAVLNSSSWRVTRPLRVVGTFLRAYRDGRVRILMVNLSARAFSGWRRHGLFGLLGRLPKYLRSLPRFVREHSQPVSAIAANPFAVAAPICAPLRLHPELLRTTGVLVEARVSVVIPVLNGGVELQLLVRKLLGQQGLGHVEVVVVDSGSTDGALDHIEALGVRVVHIRPEEFSHSHARNLGADHATGTHLVFMVQDAYPIGDRWLYGLVSYLQDHAEHGVVAASCAEYCRADSDAMYDCGVNTHYRFLGCLQDDRIGRFVGDDHMSLRSMGQLSDVACLIPRPLFQQFRYRGDYAEDLDLGIRLIRAGHKVAMLASVKVVHSHNRPAWYYLKRTFVDVIFLVGLFDDFERPGCRSVHGLLQGIEWAAKGLGQWLPTLRAVPDGASLTEAMEKWVSQVRQWDLEAGPDWIDLDDNRVDGFVRQLLKEGELRLPVEAARREQVEERRRFVDGFTSRLEHFARFAAQVYGPADARLREEFAAAALKTFAATVGAALAFWVLDRREAGHTDDGDAELLWANELFSQLKAGV